MAEGDKKSDGLVMPNEDFVSVEMSLGNLRARLLESMKRLTLQASFSTIGLALDILEPSGVKIEVVTHFPPCYKLVPISDASRFVLMPLSISTFKSASTPLELIRSITDCVTQAYLSQIKVVQNPPYEFMANEQVPKDNTNGIDVSAADGVFTRNNMAWREVLSYQTRMRRTGVRVTMGVIYPEFLVTMRRRFTNSCIEHHQSLATARSFQEHKTRFILFCKRRGLMLQHSDPSLPDIACVALLEHRSNVLPRLIENFPLSNFISVIGCMSFTQMQAELSIPPPDLASSLNISSSRSSIIKDIISMSMTSEAHGDFERIFFCLLNPSQVLLDFDLTSMSTLSPKLRVLAVFLCKILFTCSRTFTNISEDQAQLLDEYMMDNIHGFNLTRAQGTITGMSYKGRVNEDSLSLATNINNGTGWINDSVVAETRIPNGLYEDVVNAPVYGNERPVIPLEAAISPDELNAVLPPMWHRIFNICSTINTLDTEKFASFLSAYLERCATYLIRLSSFVRSFYEHGLRLPTRVVCRLHEPENRIHGPPLRMTINMKSIFLYFMHLPQSFKSLFTVHKQLSIESDMMIQISLLIESFRQHREMVRRMDLARIISLRDTFKIVSENLKGGLIGYLRLAISQNYVGFLDGFERIAENMYVTPQSTALADMFANFYNTPEWFGATNSVVYTLSNYTLPSRSREERIAQGIILTNEVIGNERRMPMAEWQVHLSRGDLLFTLYTAREEERKIVLDWYIPRELVVSERVVETPSPFIIKISSENSSESTITFNKFVEYHVIGGDVEPSVDQWLINDNVHKFQIIHNTPTLTLREGANVNDMVQRIDYYYADHVQFTSFLSHLEKMFIS